MSNVRVLVRADCGWYRRVPTQHLAHYALSISRLIERQRTAFNVFCR